MDDKKANEYAQTHYNSIYDAGNNKNQNLRALRLLIKEVERDTRHKAVQLIQDCHMKVFNLEH